MVLKGELDPVTEFGDYVVDEGTDGLGDPYTVIYPTHGEPSDGLSIPGTLEDAFLVLTQLANKISFVLEKRHG